MCDFEYILNGQGTSKVYGNQTMEMGANLKSRRNERGYDLEKLWIGTSEGKDTRTIQYPVISRWAKELDKTTSGVNKVLYLRTSMQWTQVAVDGKSEMRLKD